MNIEKFTLDDLLNKVLVESKENDGLGMSGDITICEDQRYIHIYHNEIYSYINCT